MIPSLWLFSPLGPGLRLLLPAFLLASTFGRAAQFTDLCADRIAIEHVYYQHRLGNKPPFEQTMPPALAEKLVREDLHKESVLKKVYHVELTPAKIAAEVQRINTTTRAPDVLAELKAALGNDTNRFAHTVAEPILVERILRDKFENDDALHALQRKSVEAIREKLLSAKVNRDEPGQLQALLQQLGSNQVAETTWSLGKPPEPSQGASNLLSDARKRFGPNAQVLSSPDHTSGDHNFYFADLPPDLQQVLQVQLRQPGDVSAVVETPGGFQLFLCKEKTAMALTVATLSIPKRSYEQWLAEQN